MTSLQLSFSAATYAPRVRMHIVHIQRNAFTQPYQRFVHPGQNSFSLPTHLRRLSPFFANIHPFHQSIHPFFLPRSLSLSPFSSLRSPLPFYSVRHASTAVPASLSLFDDTRESGYSVRASSKCSFEPNSRVNRTALRFQRERYKINSRAELTINIPSRLHAT